MLRTLGRNASISLLLLAVAAGGALGYYVASVRAQQEQADMFYLTASLNARAIANSLTQLRSRGSDSGIKLLEAQLDIELITLGFYEKYTPPNRRLGKVYADVAKVREYFKTFPEAHSSPYAAEGLALGATTRVP